MTLSSFSMTFAIFHDFPGLENGLPKFHDFPWPGGTLVLPSCINPRQSTCKSNAFQINIMK